KGRADAFGAFDGNVAAHHLAELPADHEPEPRPAILARGGGVRLRERLEQLAELLLAHADAGIGDAEANELARLARNAGSGQRDRSLFGELARVAEEVEERLPHLREVRLHAADVRRDIQ